MFWFNKKQSKPEAKLILPQEIPQWKKDHPDWSFDRHESGRKAAETLRQRYGNDWYTRLSERASKAFREELDKPPLVLDGIRGPKA